MSDPKQQVVGQDLGAVVAAGMMATSVDERIVVLPIKAETELPIGTRASGEPFLLEPVLAAMDARRPAPARRSGTRVLHELEGFIEYVNRHKQPGQSIVYANGRSFQVACVFDDHPEGANATAAAWRDFRAVYTCPRAREWDVWTQNDGKQMSQEAFAQFIESNLEDLIGPQKGQDLPLPAEVLDMTRNLQINMVGTFKRVFDPTSGTGTLVSQSEHGQGSTRIPRAFQVALRVFDGGDRYPVEARVRFSCSEGKALFSYTLHRRAEIERDAFADVRIAIATRAQLPVLAGEAA